LKKITSGILVLALSMMFAAVLATPTLAAPPEEKKVEVEVTFTISSNTLVERYTTNGNISHRIYDQDWDVFLTIGKGSTPIEGTAEVYRETDYRYTKPGGVDQVINDCYVFSFPSVEGGFEGQSHSIVTDWSPPPTGTYNIRVHVLLHGTGAFEGQTLNAWQNGPGTVPLWEGYLLKP